MVVLELVGGIWGKGYSEKALSSTVVATNNTGTSKGR